MSKQMPVIPAGHSNFVVITQRMATPFFQAIPRLRDKIANIGEIAGYLAWIEDRFGVRCKPLARRESLWQSMRDQVVGSPVRGFEFGVAWGYASQWWLNSITSADFRWEGFDRFTGLPRAWRKLPAGAFDAGGKTPPIEDARVIWHVGDVEDTIQSLNLKRDSSEQWIVVFDLDVFEPSRAAWEYLRGSLRKGDLLYFDEAFDRDERYLLDHFILPSGSFTFIGATPVALALRVEEIS
jgi:hypothetical protein